MIDLKLIAGSYPPDVCGVGDYTEILVNSLREHGKEARVSVSKHTKISLREVLQSRNRVVYHVQYPAVGYKKSLKPFFILLFARYSVVTLHEFSQSHWLRKLFSLSLVAVAKRVILTNLSEEKSIAKFIPWARGKIKIIPIGSNIPAIEKRVSGVSGGSIVYFGLIRPGKGLEEYFEYVKSVKEQRRSFEFRVVGAIPEGCEDYFKKAYDKSKVLGIHWDINRPPAEVSERLYQAACVFLYYPDGLTERRGSFLAALEHGVKIISNSGENTPSMFNGLYFDLSKSCDVLESLSYIDNYNVCSWERNEIVNYFSWSSIVGKHECIYGGLVRSI